MLRLRIWPFWPLHSLAKTRPPDVSSWHKASLCSESKTAAPKSHLQHKGRYHFYITGPICGLQNSATEWIWVVISQYVFHIQHTQNHFPSNSSNRFFLFHKNKIFIKNIWTSSKGENRDNVAAVWTHGRKTKQSSFSHKSLQRMLQQVTLHCTASLQKASCMKLVVKLQQVRLDFSLNDWFGWIFELANIRKLICY